MDNVETCLQIFRNLWLDGLNEVENFLNDHRQTTDVPFGMQSRFHLLLKTPQGLHCIAMTINISDIH